MTSAKERLADPLGPTLALGAGAERVGLAVGVVGASAIHVVALLGAVTALVALSSFAGDVRESILDRMRTTYELDQTPPPPPPPAPTAPEPEPVQPAPPQAAKAAEPPPAPAQAGKVLTSDPDPNDPVDLTGDGFVTGSGDHYAGGTTASSGTSKTAVYDPNAKVGGTPGATGKGPVNPPQAAPAQDLSRAPTPTSSNWSCPFPAEADQDQVDYAAVTLVVSVGTDGRARSVSVLSDPGHGFGRQARQCAMGKTYQVGLDRSGQPTTRTTPPITVRFNR